MEKEIAIIMAAGLGERMWPLTKTIPKPLIKIGDMVLIETIITALLIRKILKIYIVVGYMKDQFGYLRRKYREVELIENPEYMRKNNISSMAAVGEILGSADCFVCEADLFVKNQNVLNKVKGKSGYFGKLVSGYSDDWIFETEGGRITSIHKGGTDCYNMVGISYWKKEDAAVIRNVIKQSYMKPGHENMFWDEAVDKVTNRIHPVVIEVGNEEIFEIDTVEEYMALEEDIMQ